MALANPKSHGVGFTSARLLQCLNSIAVSVERGHAKDLLASPVV